MYQFDREFMSELFKDAGRAIVRKICTDVESLQKDLDKNSPEFKYLNHVKNLHRENIYQAFRDLENNLKAYQEGKKLTKFNVYTPPDSDKKSA